MNRKILGLVQAAALAATAVYAQQPAAQPAPAPAAQQPAPPPADQQIDTGAPIVRLNANEVNLIFTVTDKHGHYIPNLRQSDFALLDDNKAPASVQSFHQQINLP